MAPFDTKNGKKYIMVRPDIIILLEKPEKYVKIILKDAYHFI